jgi:hypothetical protein
MGRASAANVHGRRVARKSTSGVDVASPRSTQEGHGEVVSPIPRHASRTTRPSLPIHSMGLGGLVCFGRWPYRFVHCRLRQEWPAIPELIDEAQVEHGLRDRARQIAAERDRGDFLLRLHGAATPEPPLAPISPCPYPAPSPLVVKLSKAAEEIVDCGIPTHVGISAVLRQPQASRLGRRHGDMLRFYSVWRPGFIVRYRRGEAWPPEERHARRSAAWP